MAKSKTESQSQFQLVQFGAVAFNHERINVDRRTRRPRADRDTLKKSLALDGWLPTKGVIAVFKADSAFAKSEGFSSIVDEEYKRRESVLEELLKDEGNRRVELDVFRSMFCDEKGNLLHPTLIGNICNGRGEDYYPSQVARARGELTIFDNNVEETVKIPAKDPVSLVPVYIRDYRNNIDRVVDQIDENSKKEGFKETSNTDKLFCISRLVKEGGWSQVQVRGKFPGTIGQKGYLISRLDQLWSESNDFERFPGEEERPNLNLVARCCDLKGGDKERIAFSTLNDVSTLALFLARSTPKGLEQRNALHQRKNQELVEKGKAPEFPVLMPATAEELETYFSAPTKKEGAKAIAPKEWNNLLSNDCKIIREIANAHLNGEVGEINSKVARHAPLLNEVMDLIEQGGEVELLAILKIARKHPAFPKFLEAAVSDKDIELVIKDKAPAPAPAPALPAQVS